MNKLILGLFIFLALVALASLVFVVVNFINNVEHPNFNSILYSALCLIIFVVCIVVIVWISKNPKKP
jgi:hypothetical protein